MATANGTFVSVTVNHPASWRNYKAAGFEFSFKASSGGVANWDKQIIKVAASNGQQLYYREHTGYLSNMDFGSAADVTTGSFAPQGQRHSWVVTIATWDSKGDPRFQAETSVTGYGFYTPKLNAGMFKNGTATATSRSITYTGLDTPQNERLSYQNWNATGYRQNTAGTKNGTASYTGLTRNTKQELAFGMVESNQDNGCLGNGEARRILVPVYPEYSALTKGTFSAERILNLPGSIKCVWGAWSNFGTIPGATAYLDVIDNDTGTTIKTQSINVKTSGNATVTGVPLDKPISIRIRVTLTYFDNTNKTELSKLVDLGYSSLIHYAVGDGDVKRVISTMIMKDDGTLARVVGVPFIKE